MSNQQAKPASGWRRTLGQSLQAMGMAWQRLVCGLANLRRRLWRKRLPGYVLFTLNQELSERSPVRAWWWSFVPGAQAPLSLADLSDSLRRVASDPDVRGVLFLVKTVPLGLTQAQSLAMLFDRFREWDRLDNGPAAPKQIIVHLEQITRTTYVAACAADQILVTPLTGWDVIGLHTTPTFWKETLKLAGIEMDVVKVAPWKTAFDTFSEPAMTPEYEAQVQWLYDSLYKDLVETIAQRRKLSPATVHSLIDGAPWNAEEAQAAGLIDGIAYEDQLPALLGQLDKPATLKPYREVQQLLLRRPRRGHPQAIGVISLTGSIIPGQSRSFPVPLPLFGEEVLGHLTAQQQIRAARKQTDLAAVVVYVDSRGGSSLASDLIWRELSLLNAEKPVVVYMGSVAGSGGYYISLPSRQIVAQRGTLTGSIGVITAKPVLQGTYEKLQARRYTIQRGAHAGLYSEDHPWRGSERAKIEESVRYNYDQFKQRVATDRNLPFDQLDPICNGRVWTGAQALEWGLIDTLGDFHTAVECACRLADLPTDGTVDVHDLTPPQKRLLAEPSATAAILAQLYRLANLDCHFADEIGAELYALLGCERYWWLTSTTVDR
jgi:protease IV